MSTPPKTTIPKCIGASNDGRTSRWRITCPDCGHLFEPQTTYLATQEVECPGKHCGAWMIARYNDDVVELKKPGGTRVAQLALTGTMRAAVVFAHQRGDELVRFPGGFWSHAGWRQSEGVADFRVRDDRWFGASTVQALVKRGAMEYTEHAGSASKFPVRARLTAVGLEAAAAQ